MLTITEEKNRNQSIYIVSDGKTYRFVECRTRILTESDSGSTICILYDTQCNIHHVSELLSAERFGSAADYKVYLAAFKALQSFCDIFSQPIEKMDARHCRMLVDFLLGVSSDGDGVSMKLKTTRSPQTVNTYLSCYRWYLLKTKCTDHPLLDGYDTYIGLATGRLKKQHTNTIHVRETKPRQVAPIHVTPSEFIRLRNIIRQSDADELSKLEAELIVSLQFLYGLRIGEVLALTTEDMSTRMIPVYDEQIDYDHITGEIKVQDIREVGILTLRNRLCTDPGRGCKNLTRPKSPASYNSAGYKTQGIGFDEVPISMDLYVLLESYIRKSTIHFKGKKYKKYAHESVADSVAFYQLENEVRKTVSKSQYSNRYLFLDEKGKRLQYQAWNKRLKKYFISAGLVIDTGIKRIGLNHRLRHGYAMCCIARLRASSEADIRLKLMHLMRHRSFDSISPYFTPPVQYLIDHLISCDLTGDKTSEEELMEIEAFYEKAFSVMNEEADK